MAKYKWSLASDFIQNGKLNKAVAGDLIEFEGFSESGVGDGTWKFTGTENLTPSQTPAERGAAELVDGSGRLWEFVGAALFLEQIGAVLDGATDNSLVVDAAQAWCQSTKGNVYIGFGIMRCTMTVLTNDFTLIGLGIDKSIIRLIDGYNSSFIDASSCQNLVLKNMTIDGNRANQTGGHAIRTNNVTNMTVESCLITNAYGYGIGCQSGFVKNAKFHHLVIDGCGIDGIDIKDIAEANEDISIFDVTIKNYDLLSENGKPAIDFRGPITIDSVRIYASNPTNIGIRGRTNTQGRAASDSNVSDIYMECTAAQSGTFGFAFEAASSNININNAIIKGFAFGIQEAGANHKFSNVDIDDCVFGVDLLGNKTQVSSCNVINCATRALDIDPACEGVKVIGFDADSGVRVQSGASNTQLAIVNLYGAAVSNFGTNTQQTAVLTNL